MKLNKENYEYLMFELLEGNLNESEKQDILDQINNDEFFLKEWKLMQYTIAYPNEELIMVGKENLLKSELNRSYVITFGLLTKIAAAIVIVGALIVFQLNYNKASHDVSNNKRIKKTEPTLPGNIEKEQYPLTEVNKNDFSQTSDKIKIKKGSSEVVKDEITLKDSFTTQLSFIIIEPMGVTGFAYNDPENITNKIETGLLEKPLTKNLNKIEKSIVKGVKIRNTTLAVLKDIPYMTIKFTPRIKDKKPGISLKIEGLTTYANAIIEIK